MKSSEIKEKCPICGKLVGKEGLNKHISITAFYEKRGNLQRSKDHLNYKFSKLIK
jgi:hypothetical protein